MLSVLARDFFAHSNVLLLPVLSLILFCAVFTVATWRTLRRGKEAFDHLASLPLDGEADGQGAAPSASPCLAATPER